VNTPDHAWLRAVNDLIHDVMAGLVPGAVLSLWLVRGAAQTSLDPVAFGTLVRGWSWIVFVILGALAMLALTGAIRTGHRSVSVSPRAKASQFRAVLTKHAVLVTVFATSIAAAFVAIRP